MFFLPFIDSHDEAADCTAIFAFRAFGVRIGVRTNETALLEHLTEAYPPLWQPLAFTDEPLRVDRIFTLRATRSKFTLLGADGFSVRSRRAAIEDLERRIKIYVAEMAPRRVFVHAGVVAWCDRAIVIPGSSYAGKTSLVAALVKAGATYYSDEYAVFDLQGRVNAYPQPLAIRKPDSGSSRQYNTPAAKLGGVTGTKPLPVGLVFVSQYQAEARWRLTPLSAGQTTLELFAHTVPARRKPAVVLPTLSKVAAQASAYKCKRGEADATAARVLHLLEDSPHN
ncbi:MAG: hypothetical protein HOP19_00015 [Acidobacteria bacterium]|nr:hypothetical protein [Acidobacteriota bacterium]